MEYDGLEIMLLKYDNGALGKVSSNYDVIVLYNFGDISTCKKNRSWSLKYPGQKDWVSIPGIMLDTAEVAHHSFQDEIDELVIGSSPQQGIPIEPRRRGEPA